VETRILSVARPSAGRWHLKQRGAQQYPVETEAVREAKKIAKLIPKLEPRRPPPKTKEARIKGQVHHILEEAATYGISAENLFEEDKIEDPYDQPDDYCVRSVVSQVGAPLATGSSGGWFSDVECSIFDNRERGISRCVAIQIKSSAGTGSGEMLSQGDVRHSVTSRLVNNGVCLYMHGDEEAPVPYSTDALKRLAAGQRVAVITNQCRTIRPPPGSVDVVVFARMMRRMPYLSAVTLAAGEELTVLDFAGVVAKWGMVANDLDARDGSGVSIESKKHRSLRRLARPLPRHVCAWRRWSLKNLDTP
jgi:hypothetical protein